MGNERGGMMGAALVADLVSPRRRRLSMLSVVRPLLSFVRCRSFVLVRRGLVLRRGRLASLVWGGVQGRH